MDKVTAMTFTLSQKETAGPSGTGAQIKLRPTVAAASAGCQRLTPAHTTVFLPLCKLKKHNHKFASGGSIRRRRGQVLRNVSKEKHSITPIGDAPAACC